MNRKRVIRSLGRHVPRWLRGLRARLLLERQADHMGIKEVRCPACEGTGLLSDGPIERCPICRGFLNVPSALADWFEVQMRRAVWRQTIHVDTRVIRARTAARGARRRAC